MAATLNITINVSNGTITQLNADVLRATKGQQTVVEAVRILEKILAGGLPANVIVTSRDTDPSVGTSGSGSTQVTFSHA